MVCPCWFDNGNLQQIINSPYAEELRMTFQIVLIGKDGLVVASDRRVAVRSPGSGDWQFIPGTKFCESDTVVCAAAGGPQAQSIATAIVNHCKPASCQSEPEWIELLRMTAEGIPGNSVGDEVIVARKDVPTHVFHVARNNQVAGVQKVDTRLCTGTSVTARFLSQHLWSPTTIEQLSWLALLAVAYATEERPSEVGFGIELMTLSNTGVTRRTPWSIDDKQIVALRDSFLATVQRAIFHAHLERQSAQGQLPNGTT